jgi:hypothetical protein
MNCKLPILLATMCLTINAEAEVFEKCDNSNRSVYGAYRNSNVDLAKNFVGEKYPNAKPTKVGVIDSGFDKGFTDRFQHEVKTDWAQSWMQRQSLKNKTGLSLGEMTSPDKDEVGHGLAVMSIIASKDIGINPKAILHSFKYIFSGSPKTEMIPLDLAASETQYGTYSFFYAIMNACDAGNKIINMSMGDISTEVNFSTFENMMVGTFNKKPLHQYLYDKGCILYMSSGNAGVKDDLGLGNKPNPSIVRVGSTNRMAVESDFSSVSHIKATGEKVLALFGDSLIRDISYKCRGENEYLVSGTSFSSPIVAGGQSLVSGMLETSPSYKKLSENQRVDLLNNIMSSGSRNGIYDAYRSVTLADRWIREHSKEPKAINVTVRPVIHPSNSNYCQTAITCNSSDRQCVNSLRMQSAICEVDKNEQLIHVADQNNEFEWFLSLFYFGTKGGTQVSTPLKDGYKRRILSSYSTGEFSPIEALTYSRFIIGLYPEEKETLYARLFGTDLQNVLNGRNDGAEAAQFIEQISMLGLIDGATIDLLVEKVSPKSAAFHSIIDALVNSKKPIDDFHNRLNRVISMREAAFMAANDKSEQSDAEKAEFKEKITAIFVNLRYESIFKAKYSVPGRDKIITDFVDSIDTAEQVKVTYAIFGNYSISRTLRLNSLVKVVQAASNKNIHFEMSYLMFYMADLEPSNEQKYEIYKSAVKMDNLYGLDYFSLLSKIASDKVMAFKLRPELEKARRMATYPEAAQSHYDFFIAPLFSPTRPPIGD